MTKRLHVVQSPSPGRETESNPLLRGIPDPADDRALIRLIGHDPFRDRDWVRREATARRLPDILRSVFVPTPASLELARTLLDALHNGYDRRDPRNPGVWASFYKDSDAVTYGEASPTFADAVAIAGITGLGKSHQVNRVLSVLPQTIHHKNLGGRLADITQIVWIYIDMSTAGGLEALLLELLEKIDTLLGRQEYRAQHATTRVNIDKLINTLIRALKTHFCGMLVLDEVQRLNFGQKQASERVRNLMLKLLNSGIPVVLIGNPLGLQFNEKQGVSAQLIRRLKANGRVRLNPADAPDDEEWITLVRGLWRCQILPEPSSLTGDHFKLLYRLTGGFPNCLAHLLACSQQRAIAKGVSQLTLDLIEQTARSNPMLNEMRALIEAFVTRDAFKLRAFSDVDMDYYRKKWEVLTDTLPPVSSQTLVLGKTASKSQQEVNRSNQTLAKSAQTKERKMAALRIDPTTPQTDYLLQSIDAMVDAVNIG